MHDQLDSMVDPGEEPDKGFEAKALQSIPFEVGHSRLIGSDCAGRNALLPPAYSCNQRVFGPAASGPELDRDVLPCIAMGCKPRPGRIILSPLESR